MDKCCNKDGCKHGSCVKKIGDKYFPHKHGVKLGKGYTTKAGADSYIGIDDHMTKNKDLC